MARSVAVRRQRGLSLIALLFVGVVAGLLALLGFRLVPPIAEYIAIERAIQKVRTEGTTVGEIRSAFDKHALIDDITSIKSKDLDITKDGDRVVIAYAYSYSVPIFENVRLVIDFAGTTRDRPGRAGR